MKKRSKTKQKTSVVMSAKKIQDLRLLSVLLAKIIPATSFPASSLCFKKIAIDNDLIKFWPKQKEIKASDSIYEFLKRVYKNHRKIFYKIMREYLPIGIEKRHKSGLPVIKSEMEAIDEVLIRLDVNLTQEFKELNLPVDLPSVIPPIKYLKDIPEKIGLHPFLAPECNELYKNGHLNEAIRKALEKYEVYVQKKSGSEKQGTDLMAEVFNQDIPKIEISDIESKRGKALQDGFKLLSMGMMGFWRNYLSHGDEKQLPAKHALSILMVVSHALHVIDGDVVKDNKINEEIEKKG